MNDLLTQWMYLFRFLDFLGACFSTWVGAYISGARSTELVVSGLVLGLAVAGNNAFNDAVDVEADRIDKPHRPVASGRIAPATAAIAGLLLALLALLVTWVVFGLNPLLYLGGVTFLGFFYSLRLKRVPFLGNLIVAGSAGFTFLFGGLIAHNLSLVFFPAMTISLVLLNREIVKTVEDIQGDSLVGARTLPILLGTKAAIALAFVVAILSMFTSFMPVISGSGNLVYLALLVVGVYLPLLYGLSVIIRRGISKSCLDSYMKWTRVLFVTGPIAFLFLK